MSAKVQRPVPSRKNRLLWFLLFLLYLVLLLFFIFSYTPRGERNVNLVFFQEIRRFHNAIKGGYITQTAYQNLLGNVVLFIPYGVLLPLTSNRRWTFPKTFFSGLFLITLIESAQYLFAIGVFDVDDFLLNGLGVVLGWAGWRLVNWIDRRFLT